MAQTPNYNLYVTDDNTELFLTWREKMNATTNSNITTIDSVLGDKADKSSIASATLLASAWTASSGSTYTQSIYVAGITDTTNGLIDIATSATASQREAASLAKISVYDQTDDILTVVATGTVPTINIPVQVLILW